MIVSGSLPNYSNCVYDIDLSLDSPISGFEFSLMRTGIDGSFKTANIITFSGAEGYLFDESGNFFDGYKSGVLFNLKIFHDHTNSTFSYFKDDLLISNKLEVTGDSVLSNGSINHVNFEKHGQSTFTLNASGVIT